MCPQPENLASEEMEQVVPVETSTPHTTPSESKVNGHGAPPPVKSHKGMYGRASDFLSNTSNWKVSMFADCVWTPGKR